MADPKGDKAKGKGGTSDKPIADDGEDWFSAVDEWEKNFELTPGPGAEGTQPGKTSPESTPAIAAVPTEPEPPLPLAANEAPPLQPIEVTNPGVELPMEAASMPAIATAPEGAAAGKTPFEASFDELASLDGLAEPPALDAVPGAPAGNENDDPFLSLFEPPDMEVSEEPLPDAEPKVVASAPTTPAATVPAAASPVAAAPRAPAPAYDDEDDDLEISVSHAPEPTSDLADSMESESTRVVSSSDMAGLVGETAPETEAVRAPVAAPASDDDFYDDISIEAGKEEKEEPAPAPTPAPVEKRTVPAAKIGADAPTMAFSLNDEARLHARLSDPDSTPLPVGDDEPAAASKSAAPAQPAAQPAKPAVAPTAAPPVAAPKAPAPVRLDGTSEPSVTGRWKVPAPKKAGDASEALAALDVLERDALDESTAVLSVAAPDADSFFDETALGRREKRESKQVQLARLPLPELKSILDEVADRTGAPPLDSGELVRRQALFDTERLLASEGRVVAQLALAAGRIAEQLNDFTLAADHYETAVASQGDWLVGHDSLRRARLRLGAHDVAATALDRAAMVASANERAPLVEYRAELLAATGEQGAALQSVDQARTLPGNDAWATGTLALELAARRREPRRLTEALDSLEKGAEADGERRLAAALYLLIGQSAERAGQHDVAQRAFSAALELDGALERAAWGRLRVALRTPDATDDIESGQRLLDFVSPGPARAALERRLGLDRDRVGKAEEAGLVRNLLERAAVDRVGLRTLAEFEHRTGHLDRAVGAYARLAQAGDERDAGRIADLWVTVGELEEERGGTAAAAAAYRRAATENPAELRAAKGLERTLADGGDKQAALDRELSSAQTSRDAGERRAALVRAARLDHELGRSDRALQHLEAVLESEPGYAPAVERYVEIAASLGQPEHWTAIAHLLIAAGQAAPAGPLGAAWLQRAAVAACGGTDPALLDRALEALRERDLGADGGVEAIEWQRLLGAFARPRLDRSLAELAAEIEMRDETRAADLVYARVVLSQLLGGDLDAAQSELGRVLALDPLHRPALGLCRLLAARQGRAGEGASLLAGLASAVRGEHEKVAALTRSAVSLVADAQDPGAALRVLADARIDKEPGVAELAAALGQKIGSDAERARLYAGRFAGATDPAHRLALGLTLASLYEKSGHPERALEVCRELSSLEDPGVAVLRRRLLRTGSGQATLAEMALDALKVASTEKDRVEAYHHLAFLDERLRGDPQSAELAYSSMVELDPTHPFAHRSVEQRLLRDGDRSGLVDLYRRAAAASPHAAQAAAWALDGARLAGTDAEARPCFELAIDREPTTRPALKQLLRITANEANAHRRAELSTRLAAASIDDPRTIAICLTRAAEAELEAGRVPDARRLLEAARSQKSDHLPALLGAWVLALVASDAPDDAATTPLVIDLAEAIGRASRNKSTQAEVLLFAGAQSQVQAQIERAVVDLQASFAADPSRVETFTHLEQALEQKGDFAALAQLYEQRLPVEADPHRQLELHLGLARLYRDRLGDKPRARQELTRALALESSHLPALRQAADLAYEAADWPVAAELHIREAKLETEPKRSHDVFVRLGEIYRAHLPDPKRAIASYLRACKLDAKDLVSLQHLSDLFLAEWEWKGALQATQRLADLEPDLPRKVTHLHRVARIYEEGFSDAHKALETLRRAHELDLLYVPAIGELAKYFDRTSDVQSMRVHLDRAALRFRQAAAERPYDAEAYHALFKIFSWRRTPDRAYLVAGILDYLNAIAADEKAVLDRGTQASSGYPGPSFAEAGLDELLFDARIPAGLRLLLRRLDEPLVKAQRGDPKRWNLGKNDRLPSKGHPVRDVANRLAADLGIRELDVYVTAAHPRALIVEPGEPTYVVLGQLLTAQASEAELRFYLGRALRLAHSRVLPLLRGTPDEVAAFVGGLVRQYVPDFEPRGVDGKLLAAEQQRLAKVVPKKLHAELLPFALECTAASFDLKQIAAALTDAGNRAGLLAAGASASALRALLRLDDAAQLRSLLAFILSDEVAEMRRLAGVGVG